MSETLRLLWVEDSPEDAELLSAGLTEAGLLHEVLRVEDEAALCAALESFAPDLVLADLSLPGFSGQRALEVVRERQPRLPFVFVSGTIGEDVAIDALRNGAADYILKQAPARLPAAVERAIREARLVAERERIAAELVRAQRLQSLALLIGDLGHEIRNLLQPLALTPTLLRQSNDPNTRQIADIVDDCVVRGSHMVESMLSFVQGAGFETSSDSPRAHTVTVELGQRRTGAPAELLLVDADHTRLTLAANALAAQGYRVAASDDYAAATAELHPDRLPKVAVIACPVDLSPIQPLLQHLIDLGYTGPVVALYEAGAMPDPEQWTDELITYYLAQPVPMTRLVETVGRLHLPRSG